MKWQTEAASAMMEVANNPILGICSDRHNPRYGGKLARPGAYLERLSPETREKLRNLKSDDIANVRVMPWWN